MQTVADTLTTATTTLPTQFGHGKLPSPQVCHAVKFAGVVGTVHCSRTAWTLIGYCVVFNRILHAGERVYMACSADNQAHSIKARVAIQLGRLLPCKRTTTLWLFVFVGRTKKLALGWLRGVRGRDRLALRKTVYGCELIDAVY